MPARTLTGRNGYTLVELLIVLCLAGAFLSLTVAALESWLLPDWRVRAATFSLASTLRAARAKAMIDRVEISVPFDEANDRYTTVAEAPDTGVTIVYGASGEISRVVTLPTGVLFARPDTGDTITLTPPETTEKTAVFSWKGLLLSSASPGYVHLGNPRRNIYRRVKVNKIGTVTVQRWTGGSWE